MSTVRAAVESVFGDISTYFALLDFKKNLKIDLSPFVIIAMISKLPKTQLSLVPWQPFTCMILILGNSKILRVTV